jgi:hypothetical protein
MPFGAKKAAQGLAALPPEQLYQQAKESFVQGGAEKWRSVMEACKQLIGEDMHTCVQVCAHARRVRRKLPIMPADRHPCRFGLLSLADAEHALRN